MASFAANDPRDRQKPVNKRFKLIACEIFFREICSVVACCDHIIDIEFLRKGLHDAGRENMFAELKAAVQKADEEQKYDAILLGYGRCNDGVVGLSTKSCPLVIPKVHDCIAVFFWFPASF